jgi:hypothetical protein
MKNFKQVILLTILVVISFCLCACGNKIENNNTINSDIPISGNSSSSDKDSSSGDSPSSSSSTTEDKKDIVGISFDSQTFDYDGKEKYLLIEGTLPSGVVATYQNNKGTNAGFYNSQVILTGSGYNTKILTATLTINKIDYDLTNVKWNYLESFTYDGTIHSVFLTNNIPNGLKVKSYQNNSYTNAGNYEASVVFEYDKVNYNEPTFNSCEWEIKRADILGITFTSDVVEYDSLSHSIEVVGDIPKDSTIVYTYNDQEINSVIEVGSYNVKAIITNENYNTLTLNATLTIKSTEKQLYSVNNGNQILFQNDLDNDRLYSYQSGELTKLSNDIPSYMITSSGITYYFSNSLFSQVIKSLSNNITKTELEISGQYLTTDGTYLYYSNNSLFNSDENGIYKIKIGDSDSSKAIKLTSDKGAYLTFYNGYIFYSNLSNKKYLSKISVDSIDGQSSVLWEEKVSYLIQDGDDLFFDSAKETLGVSTSSAIYRYIISSNKFVKLTIDSGKYLCKVGNYIYYINNDLLTSTVFGDGIYRVSSQKEEDSNVVGYKIISSNDNGYSSLTCDSENLYYYKLNDKHFYSFNISASSENDIMKDFVVAQDSTLSGYANIATFNGEIYYTNILDNSCLYKYNLTTKQSIKVLSNSVSNVYFYNNFMYYSTFVVTNYALYKMDLNSKISTKIATCRCEDLTFDGSIIYFKKIGAGGTYSNAIYKMNDDGTNLTKLYDDKNLYIKGFQKYKDDIYFIINPRIGYNYIYKYSITNNSSTSLQIKAYDFVIANDVIYYYSQVDKMIEKCDLLGSNIVSLVSNVDINDLIVQGDIMYYSSTFENNVGTYIYNLSTSTINKIYDKNASAMINFNNKIYFIQTAISYSLDYPTNSLNSSGKLCSYDGNIINELS